ncbi:uncharacterized protein LOC144173950 isoform X1 [Haemaphysalis longicornis]
MARVSSDSTDSGMKKEGTMRLGKPEPSVSDCAQAESGNKENVVEQSEAGCTRGWKMQSHGISGPERAAAPKGLLACNAEKRKRNKLSLPKPNRTPEAAAHTTPNDSQSTETRSLQEPSSRGNSAGVANTSAPEGHEKTQVKTPRKLSSISEPKSGATKRAIESSSHTQQNAGITTPALPKRMHGETTKEAGRNVQSGPLTSSIANEETGRAQKDVMAQFAAHEKTPEELSRKLGTQAVSKVAANKGTIKESYKTQRDATVNSGAQMKKTDRKIAKVAGSQAKGRSPAGKESYVEDRNDAKQAPKARSMALDEGRANTKGMLKKRAGTHEKTGPVASSRSPKSKENATTNTSLTSPAPPQPKRLRDKTPRNVTSRSGGLATPEGGASPPNKPARGKPAGGAAASQMAGEKSGKMVTKDAFETPNVARPTRPQFPPTPLKQRAPKKTTLEKTPKQSTKERLAVSEELQSDPETPFGFKLKRLKLELERCDLTEQMLHTQKESLKDEHEKDQAVLCTKRTRAEARPARDDGCKLGDSGKGRHKAGKNNKCLKSSSTTQPEILARSDEEKAGNASEQPGLSRSFEDKMSNALSTEPSRSSVAANAKNAKQQLGIKSSNTSADTGETSQRSSQNLGGLTQNPNVEGRPREAHNKLFLVETKAGAFEFGKEDGFPSFMGALDERALYSQMETKKEMYTAAARDAFLMEANMEKGPANTKQKAEQRHGLTGVNEQCIAKPNRQKRGRAFEDASSLNINCDDNTSTFFDFDTPAAERCEPSTSFFQMKLMPTPLSFSDDRNEDDADEVFPWLASSSPRSTADTQKRGIASQRDDARGSHLKRTNPGASTSAGSDLVWPSQEPPGHIVSRNKHDDTESDSEYGEFPPLMSRMQVAASDAASDDEYEHALDDDFPPLETP